MVQTTLLEIEVAYADPAEQVLLSLQVEQGTTVRQAIEVSGIRTRIPLSDFRHAKIGVFGKVCSPDTVCRAGDRIEIYRPLTADPKTVRRRRAEIRKKSSKI